MIVNKSALLKAAPIKDMVINKVQAQPTSWGLTECGYDIRIMQDVVFDPAHRIAYVENEYTPRIFIDGGYEKGGTHHDGRFILASSVEEFQMPNHLMGRVLNKSTWARLGVDASLTTNIEPGWNGFLTIELVFNGNNEVRIPAGSGICQIIFETLAEPAQYVGKYQNQEDKPVEAKLTSIDEVRPKLDDTWFEEADAYQGNKLLRHGKDKPVQQIDGTIKQAVIINEQCYGVIYDDTKGRFKDGTEIHTSRIIEMKGDIIRTRNSTYRIELYVKPEK